MHLERNVASHRQLLVKFRAMGSAALPILLTRLTALLQIPTALTFSCGKPWPRTQAVPALVLLSIPTTETFPFPVPCRTRPYFAKHHVSEEVCTAFKNLHSPARDGV